MSLLNSKTAVGLAAAIMFAPYIAQERLYVDEDGDIVKADDPTRVSLVCVPGQAIPHEQAVALGLIEPEPESSGEDEPPTDEPTVSEPGTTAPAS